MRFHIQNLGDKEWQDIHSAYPTPGRQYFLSISQEF
jgi:outer membrane cobalamin receptor